MPPPKHKALLCKPTMDHNKQMAPLVTTKQTSRMSHDNPLLGFKRVVDPTSQTAKEGHPSLHHTPISGDVQKLLGSIHATSKVAPDLYDIIREGLQAKQVSNEATTA